MPAHILVIDDCPSMLTMATLMLESCEMQASVAADAVEAMQVLASQRFDLIITDQEMPGMKGIELIKKIRTQAEHQQTPIIVLTSETNPSVAQDGIAAGANAWVCKPIDLENLLQEIKRQLKTC